MNAYLVIPKIVMSGDEISYKLTVQNKSKLLQNNAYSHTRSYKFLYMAPKSGPLNVCNLVCMCSFLANDILLWPCYLFSHRYFSILSYVYYIKLHYLGSIKFIPFSSSVFQPRQEDLHHHVQASFHKILCMHFLIWGQVGILITAEVAVSLFELNL